MNVKPQSAGAPEVPFQTIVETEWNRSSEGGPTSTTPKSIKLKIDPERLRHADQSGSEPKTTASA